jgi:hypothetical protein
LLSSDVYLPARIQVGFNGHLEGANMEYRRDIDKPIWHFSYRCPFWPEETFNIIISEKLPPDFKLCENCTELTQQRLTMEFRNHPILVCDGVMTWPPTWTRTHGPGRKSFVSGELGVLEAVFLSKVLIDKVYLVIHTEEDNTYIGTLTFEKANSAKAVFEFLYGQRGKPLTAIGSIDVPANFGTEIVSG